MAKTETRKLDVLHFDDAATDPLVAGELQRNGVDIKFHDGVAARKLLRAAKSVDNVSDPPTDAELDAAFGDPTVVGDGFIGILDDNDAGTDVYICFTTGVAGEWFYIKGTKAV